MSNRERWIVYPLLFFAFLMGARDEYAKPDRLDCNLISCRRLTVTSTDGQALVRIGASEDDAGALSIYGAREPIRLPGDESPADAVRKPGHEIFEVGANNYGGYVRVFGSRPGTDIQIGHDGKLRFSGLMAVDEQDDYVSSDETIASPVWGQVLFWPSPEVSGKADSSDPQEADSKD